MSPSHNYKTFYQATSMEKRSSKYRKEIQHFCFCLSLRTGSIILTVWWLISGLILSVYSFYALTLGHETAYTRIKYLTIIFTLEPAIVFVVALFGLRALVTRNTIPAIRVYVYLVWIFMVVAWTLSSAIIVTIFIDTKEEYENMCPDCINEWNSSLLKLLSATILTSIFNMYFAIILKVYLMRREIRTKHQKRDSVRNPRFSITSGMSTTNLSRSRPPSVDSFMKDIQSLGLQPVTLQSNHRPRRSHRPPTYMPSLDLNNVIINPETVETPHDPTVDDATATVPISYNDNDNSQDDSMMGDATILATNGHNLDEEEEREHPSPYEHQPQYKWTEGVLEPNFESLLGTMDITEYKN